METKPLDKKIIRTTLFLLAMTLIISLISNFYLTLKGISFIGIVLYYFFILGHIMLCYPTLVIICWTKDLIESQNFFEKIRDKSKIIYTSIVVVFCLISLCVVYFIIPLILAMMFNGSINYHTALSSLKYVLIDIYI